MIDRTTPLPRLRPLLRSLPEDARRDLAEAVAESLSEPEVGPALIEGVAELVRFRRSTVARAEPARRIRLAERALTAADERQLVFVVRCLSVAAWSAEFAEAARRIGVRLEREEPESAGGAVHEPAGGAEPADEDGSEEGTEAEEENEPKPLDEVPAMERVLRELLGEPRWWRPALCLAAHAGGFAAANPDWGPSLQVMAGAFADRDAFLRPRAQAAVEDPAGGEASSQAADAAGAVHGAEAARAAGAAEARAEVPEETDEAGAPGAGPRSPAFTTLDELLIQSAVSTMNGVEGSLGEDRLDDLVQELLELNDKRSRSWFHRGYVDGLLGRALAEPGPGENVERRSWYLAGHFLVQLRRRPVREVLAELEALGERDRRCLVGEGRGEGGAMLAESVIVPLLAKGQVEDSLAWMRAHLPVTARRVLRAVLEWARTAMVEQDPAEVRRVLQQCQDLLPEVQRFQEVPAPVARDLKRRLAIAARCEGDLATAGRLLSELLEQPASEEERARLLGDRAMVETGLGRLEDLALPAEATRATFLDALKAARPTIEASLAAAPVVPAALVAGALPVLAEPEPDDDRLVEAIDRLRRATDLMTSDRPEFWRGVGLLERAEFYRSVLELRLLRTERAPRAVQRVLRLLRAGFAPPGDLLFEVVEQASLQDAPGTAALLQEVLERLGPKLLLGAELAEPCARSAELRSRLGEYLERRRGELSANERWSGWAGLLAGSLRGQPERDLDGAGRALDELERLAVEDGLGGRLLALLEEPASWDPAWTHEDVLTCRARLHEAAGNLPQARLVLRELAHRAITDGELAHARDLLERLGLLGERAEDLQDLWPRLEAAEAEEAAPRADREVAAAGPVGRSGLGASAADPLREAAFTVLFVGGNEVQARYEDAVREAFSRDLPRCRLVMEFTGWSSNWGRQLERMDARLREADVVVVMRFVRTSLGRAVRKLAGERGVPWVACTGHGRDSIDRALRDGVRLALRGRG